MDPMEPEQKNGKRTTPVRDRGNRRSPHCPSSVMSRHSFPYLFVNVGKMNVNAGRIMITPFNQIVLDKFGAQTLAASGVRKPFPTH